jgi:hypothetical protein
MYRTITKRFAEIRTTTKFPTWNKLTDTQKCIIGTYVCGATITFYTKSYSDGESALQEYRKTNGYDNTREEKDVIKSGCYANKSKNIKYSALFPINIIADIAPFFVEYNNRPIDDPFILP